MSAADLVSRLEKARQSARGNWLACCPAHPDKHPSLTIRESDDGRVLVHCFAGCSVADILAAVGLEYAALFPERPPAEHVGKPARLRFDPRHVLQAVAEELSIVTLYAADLERGDDIPPADRDRLNLAIERILQARTYARF